MAASSFKLVALGLLLMTQLSSFYYIQTQAAVDETMCMNGFLTLEPCLSFVAGNDAAPQSSCCDVFGKFATQQTECLCFLPEVGALFQIPSFNTTKAMMLPTLCNIMLPSFHCNINAFSPAPAPAPTTPLM